MLLCAAGRVAALQAWRSQALRVKLQQLRTTLLLMPALSVTTGGLRRGQGVHPNRELHGRGALLCVPLFTCALCLHCCRVSTAALQLLPLPCFGCCCSKRRHSKVLAAMQFSLCKAELQGPNAWPNTNPCAQQPHNHVQVGGGFRPPDGVVICHNHLSSQVRWLYGAILPSFACSAAPAPTTVRTAPAAAYAAAGCVLHCSLLLSLRRQPLAPLLLLVAAAVEPSCSPLLRLPSHLCWYTTHPATTVPSPATGGDQPRADTRARACV